jgi:hypothetical protein
VRSNAGHCQGAGKFVIKNINIELATRTALAESLVFTKCEFAIGAWPALHAVAAATCHRAVVHVARDFAGLQKWRKLPGATDLPALVAAGVAAPAYRLATRRMALFAQLLQRRCLVSLAMAANTCHHRRSWSWALCKDLSWLAGASDKVAEFRGALVAAWVSLITTRPKFFLKMARKTALEATARDLALQLDPLATQLLPHAIVEPYAFDGPCRVWAENRASDSLCDILLIDSPRTWEGILLTGDARFPIRRTLARSHVWPATSRVAR